MKFLTLIMAILCASAVAASARAEVEYFCSAQCVYADAQTHEIYDFGFPATGWSHYSMGEAYIDLLHECTSPGIPVIEASQSHWSRSTAEVAGGRWYRDDESGSPYGSWESDRQGGSRYWWRTDDESESQLELYFATVGNGACTVSRVHPRAGRRYFEGHPIGG